MNAEWVIFFKLFPVIVLAFTVTVVCATVTLSEEFPLIFAFFAAQVYLNWICVYSIALRATVASNEPRNTDHRAIRMNDRLGCHPAIVDDFRLWYCENCLRYSRRPAHHCVICKKCFHYRDHHCFFMGCCVLRESMGNFILICVHTAFASLFSLVVLGPHLYEHLDHFLRPDSGFFDIVVNFSLPVALARTLSSNGDSCVLLVALFNVLFATFCVHLVWSCWKLYACLRGTQRYFPHLPKRQTITDIFGTLGIANFIFPYNGLVRIRTTDQRYEMKEI